MPGFVFSGTALTTSPLGDRSLVCSGQVITGPRMPELADVSLALLLLACGIVFVAGLVHGTLGFGFPMVATPVLALVTDVRSAILLTLLPTIAVNVPSIIRGGNWRESIGRHWPLAIYIILGSILGTHVLMVGDPSPLRLLLAGMIVLYLLPRIPGNRVLRRITRYPQLGYALFGLAAGFLAGTVNVMVPLLIIFTLELGLATTAMVQLFNFCFLSGKLAQVGTFGALGIIDAALVADVLPLIGAALVSLWLGMRLRERVEAATYRTWLRYSLALIAVLLCAQFLLETLAPRP